VKISNLHDSTSDYFSQVCEMSTSESYTRPLFVVLQYKLVSGLSETAGNVLFTVEYALFILHIVSFLAALKFVWVENSWQNLWCYCCRVLLVFILVHRCKFYLATNFFSSEISNTVAVIYTFQLFKIFMLCCSRTVEILTSSNDLFVNYWINYNK